MKRVKFGVVLIALFTLFISKVNASFYNDEIAAVANSGKITTDYKNAHSEYKSFEIFAKSNDENGGTINMIVSKEEFDDGGNSLGISNYNVGLTYYYDSDSNVYIASQTFDEDAKKDNSYYYYTELYSLFPFWCVEASDKWASDIEPLFLDSSSKLDQLKTILDKCYMSEYGVCYTTESSSLAGTTTLISKGEVSDKTADYVIKQLKQNKRDENQKNFLKKLALVFVVLVFLYALAMSYKKELANADYKKKKANYKNIEIVTKKK